MRIIEKFHNEANFFIIEKCKMGILCSIIMKYSIKNKTLDLGLITDKAFKYIAGLT